MEISSSKKRAHIAMTQCVGLTLGACLAPLIAWATRDWVTYLLLTTLPCAIFFLTPKMFIESPRWLSAKGRNKESAKVICYIGRVNGKPMQEHLVEDNLNMFTEKREKTYGVASLASSWRLARNTALIIICWWCRAGDLPGTTALIIICCGSTIGPSHIGTLCPSQVVSSWRLARNTALIIICWSISSLTVFTLMLNVVNMSGNPFLNYVWQSASELPGYFVGRWISDRFGRRWPPAISFAIATAGFLLMAATTRDPSLQWVTFITLAVTKMCITVPYYVVFLQAMETYPTSVRQTGTSLGSLASSGIGMLGPYIVYLGSSVDTRYPYIILGLLTTLAAISATFLPETLNQKLPENLTDAQNFGKDQKFWSLTPVPSSASIAKQSYALVPKDGDTGRHDG
uniref:Major facilitator superfamily (MFS) profile domain-containing protein n=1 Tax=Timema poppense TaxID=170557 RepID=A0A7R9DM98_TIMPO|nr:unnamed protein product [Timema poppensis]